MSNKKKVLEWVLRNHYGRIESTPKPVHHEHIEKYLKLGFTESIKTDDFIRLNRGNDFILYDLVHKYPVIEYYHK